MKSDKDTTIESLKRKVVKFRDERDWKKFHLPKNLAISIAIEVAELLENFQWKTDEEIEELLKEENSKKKVRREIADIIMFCLSLSEVTGIDIAESVLDKLRENEKKYPVQKAKGTAKKYKDL